MELEDAIATIFEYIEETQAGHWDELKEQLEALQETKGYYPDWKGDGV
tara:strand:+ start:1035 stop:1178 length:144 start_codon:yes stop_codon:yes gene_type:complete